MKELERIIEWVRIPEAVCDKQVDTTLKCLVADLPFVVAEDHHFPEITEMLTKAITLLAKNAKLPKNAMRIRFCEDGSYTVSRKIDTIYPDGILGAPALADYRAVPKGDRVEHVVEEEPAKPEDEIIDVEAQVE